MLQNQDTQFPLAYNFPQDDMTGVVDRSFGQEAFQGGSLFDLNSHEDIGPDVGMAGSSTVNNDGEFAVSGAGSGELYISKLLLSLAIKIHVANVKLFIVIL